MQRCTLLFIATIAPFAAHPQVINGGFESGVSNWDQPCGCAPFQISIDVPPGGGTSSFGAGIVDFNCICTITDAVHQPAAWLYPGQWVLSAWIKSADAGNIPGASVRLSEGPAFSSNVISDVWSYAGAWTWVVDTFQVTATTDIPSLQLSLIPDDGNAMPPGLFAYFDQIMIQPIMSTGMNDRYNEVLSLYPNPAETTVSITMEGPATEILLVDALGRSHGVYDLDRDGDIVNLDVTALPSGPWLVKVITPIGTRMARFVRL